MAKPALGRGLEELMPRNGAVGGESSRTHTSDSSTPVGRGVGRLLNGVRASPEVTIRLHVPATEPRQTTASSTSQAKPLWHHLKWVCLLADALLLLLAALLITRNEGPADPALLVLCVVAVATAAAIGVLPFVLPRSDQ